MSTPVAGFDTALSFDGTDDYASMPDDGYGITTSLTMEAWINPSSVTGVQHIMGKWTAVGGYLDSTYGSDNYLLALNGDKIGIWLSNNGSSDEESFTSVSSIPQNTWTHVALVFNSGTAQIYINGVLDKTYTTAFSSLGQSSLNFSLGATDSGAQYYFFNGSMDEVRVWDTALDQNQIQSNLYHTLLGNETNLVGYWNMDEGAGGSITDRSPNAGIGTLANGVSFSSNTLSQAISTEEDDTTGVAIQTFGGSDADNDGSTQTDTLQTIVTTLPSHGSLFQTPDGTTKGAQITATGTAITNTADKVIYVPDPDFNGTDSIAYCVNDGTADSSNTVTQSISVTAVNDSPTSTNDSVTFNENTTHLLTAGDFGSYSDADSDSFAQVQITTLESAGDLEYSSDGSNWTDVTQDQEITVADIDAGKLRFTPGADADGSPYATVGFKVSDGTDYSSSAYTLSLNVNDSPILSAVTLELTDTAAYDSFSIQEGSFSATDGDGSSFTYSLVDSSTVPTGPVNSQAYDYVQHGTYGDLYIQTDGDYAFVSDATAINALTADTSESFNIRVTDAQGGTDDSTYTVNLTAVNDTPTITTYVATPDITTGLSDSAFSADGASPGTEVVKYAFDDNTTTKYLNWGLDYPSTIDAAGTSVTIDAGANYVVTSLGLTTANDAENRDPASYILYGSNDNSNFTQISAGSLSPPAGRYTDYPTVSFTNITSYRYYKLTFDSIRDTNPAEVQVAEIRLGGETSNIIIYDENSTVDALKNVIIRDNENGNLASATVSITSDYESAYDTLSFTNDNGTSFGSISASFDSSTGVLSLTGTATVDQYQNALRAVQYASSSDNPTVTSTTRTLSWQVNDGTVDSDVATSTIDIQAINDAPTASLPAEVTVIEDTPSNLDLSATTFADVDGDSLIITISAGEGNMTSSSGGGVTVGGSGTGALTLAGTADNINTFLDTASNIQYTGASNASGNGATTLTINANDGTVNPQLGSVNVNITAVNDSPTVATNTGVTLNEGAVVTLSNTALNEGDSDDSGTGLTYTVTTAAVNGSLWIDSDASGTINGAESALGASGTFTQGDIDNNKLKYIHDGSETLSDSFVFSLADGGEDGATAVSNQIFTLTITPQNDAPIIRDLTGDSLNYSMGDGAIVIDQGTAAAVTDTDSTDFDGGSLTVSIVTNKDAGEDLLSLDTSGTVSLAGTTAGSNVSIDGTIVGTLDNNVAEGNDLVISLNTNATPANMQTLVRSVTYENTDTGNAVESTRTVRFILTDGDGGASDVCDSFVVVTQNSPPVITSNGGGDTAAVNVAENRTTVTSVTATDANSDTVTFSITGGADQAKFTIDADTGALRFTSAPNYEAASDTDTNNDYVVEVTAQDANGGTDVQTITVNVTDVDETPPPAPAPEPDDSDLFSGDDQSDVDDNIDTGLEPTTTFEDTTIDGAAATEGTTTDRDTGEVVQVIAVNPVTEGERVEEDATTADVDVPITDQVSVSISDNLGLIAASRVDTTQDHLQTLLERGSAEEATFNPETREQQQDFLHQVFSFGDSSEQPQVDVVEITPTRSSHSDDADSRLHVTLASTAPEGEEQVVIVNTASWAAGTESPTVDITGSGYIVVRGAGTFQGTEELDNDSLEDHDVVLGDDSDQILFFGPGDDIIYGAGGNDTVSSAGGADELYGGSGDDRVQGGDGNDELHGGSGTNQLVGNQGDDTAVFEDSLDQYHITWYAAHAIIAHRDGTSTDTLVNVETLQFADQALQIQTDGSQLSEDLDWLSTLYGNMFDRQADLGGIEYWADQLAATDLDAGQVVVRFFRSQEFQSQNQEGTQLFTELSRAEQIEAFYQNILNRTPDAEGYEYWIDRADAGMTIEDIAVGFIHSSEFQTQLLASQDWDFLGA